MADVRTLWGPGLFRLRRGLCLPFLTLLSVLWCLYRTWSWYRTNQVFLEIGALDRVLHLEDFLFGNAPYLSWLLAIFVSVFLGMEESSGGIRRAAVTGFDRRSVYLSLLLTMFPGAAVLTLVPPLIIRGVGWTLYGQPQLSMAETVLILLGMLFLAAALTALFTCVHLGFGMGTAGASVVCVLLAAGMQYGAYQLLIELNVNHAQGAYRLVCQTLSLFLPAGQAIEYSAASARYAIPMMGMALLLMIVTTGIGLRLFERRDLR